MMPERCEISMPRTLAHTEHFYNVTFYQAAAASLKNMDLFCFSCKHVVFLAFEKKKQLTDLTNGD